MSNCISGRRINYELLLPKHNCQVELCMSSAIPRFMFIEVLRQNIHLDNIFPVRMRDQETFGSMLVAHNSEGS